MVYTVDITVGFCTCRNWNTGGQCKHQASVIRTFQIPSWNFIPEKNPEIYQIISYIGIGQYHVFSWFDNLKSDHRSNFVIFELCDFENPIHSESSVSPKPEAQKSETCNVASLSEGLKRLFDDWNLFKIHNHMQKGLMVSLKVQNKLQTPSQFNSARSTLKHYSGFGFKALLESKECE